MDVKKLANELRVNGQEHLLKFWDELDEEQQARFYDDLRSIDFAKLNRSFEKTMHSAENGKGEKKDEKIKPIPTDKQGSVARAGPKLKIWQDKGLQQIGEGKVAVLLLAGGQGTRLGVAYPKGMYSVGLPSDKTLYQIQAERILKAEELAFKKTGKKCSVPWYIMTSEHTMESTRKFFADHGYFGLKAENVVMFEQNTIPCLTFEGKIILDGPGKVARAPDGNGGLYAALGKRKIIDDMKKRGIECVHAYCVDNILVKMADPVFVGFCVDLGAECGAKVVEKGSPTEAVGVVCLCDNKYEVVEYSEISLPVAERRDPDGRLTFRAGNICNHFFSVKFLESIVREHEENLRYHIAKKKIPHINDAGERVKPETPNGVKLEKFVFDVFEFAEKFALLEVLREDEFSPLKNAKGPKDTPDTARQALMNLHYRYIINAGGTFVDADGTILPPIPKVPQVMCEVSPLLSYAGEGLEELVKDKKFLSSDTLYLKADSELEEPASKKVKGN